jgi:predicted DNA-binding ribbon-helix-helix protein
MWSVRGYFCRVQEESVQDRVQRIQETVRDLNRLIIFQERVIKDISTQGLAYLDQGDEQRARAEAHMQLQAVETRQTYVDLHTKFRLLLNEIERTQSLSICVDNFSSATGVLKNVSSALKIEDVDMVMVRLEQQMASARDVSKSLQKPIANVRQVLSTLPLSLPDLPSDLQRSVDTGSVAPHVTMEL